MLCFICKKKIDTEEELIKHLEEDHKDYLEKLDRTPTQAYYHEKNRFKLKRIGICGCGSMKKWNEAKNKYEYYCGSDACKNKMNQLAVNNSIAKFGVEKPTELLDVQLKMMEARGKSMHVWGSGPGKYTHIMVGPNTLTDNPEIQKDIDDALSKGAVKYVYLSSVEEKVLLELIKQFNIHDIFAPLQEEVTYTFPGQDKVRNHIPDIYIKSLNLIISCKDSMLHPNRHPNMVEDRFKSLFEYQAILNSTHYNFFQVDGEDDIKNLGTYLSKVKEMHSKHSRYISPPKVDVFVLISEQHNDLEFIDQENSSIVEAMTEIESVIVGEHGVAFKIQNSPTSMMLHPDGGVYTSIINEGLVLDASKLEDNLLHTYDEDGLRKVESNLKKIVMENYTSEDDMIDELNGAIVTVIGGNV